MIHRTRRFIPCQTLAIAAIATFLLVSPAEQSQAGLLTSASEAQLEAWLGGGDRVFTNIYTKAAGDFAWDFHGAVDGKGPTVALMEITSVQGSTSDPDVGQIIGGYNPQSWGSGGAYYNETPADSDRTAFIFNLTTGVKQDQRLGVTTGYDRGQYQTYNSLIYGPTFGTGFDLFVGLGMSAGHVAQSSYGDGGIYLTGGENLLGDSRGAQRPGGFNGVTEVTYGQIEVFTFSDVQASSNMVPEPTSLAVFCVMGLAGCLRRRRVE